MKWWQDQPDSALGTIHRVVVAMGIEATKVKPGTLHDVILKTMTAATTCALWLSDRIRSNTVQQESVRSILPAAHSIILCLAFLTEATLSPSISVFQLCRILQTTLMGQYVLLDRAHNSKLFALLRGTFCNSLFTFATPDQFVDLSQHFFSCETVYVRFCYIAAFQPKFYIGSTSSFVLDREHSRFRKFLQVRQKNTFWPKLLFVSGTAMTIFGFGRCSPLIQFLGSWTSFNSALAAETQYSVHLWIF